MRAQLKCRPLFRLKLNNILILHEWMWHYFGAFMWKTDVSLFLSRLAGTVVWRESHLAFSSPQNLPLSPSDSPSIPSSLSPTFILGLSVLHLSISPQSATLLHSSLHNFHCLPLSLILYLCPPPPLSSSGGHALECSFLHKTTSSHYLLTTTQKVMWAAFPNISHGWHTGSLTLVFVHQSVMLKSRTGKLFCRKLGNRAWRRLEWIQRSRQEAAVVTE